MLCPPPPPQGFDSLAADAMSECSSLSTNILDISLSTFDPGSIATSLVRSPSPWAPHHVTPRCSPSPSV